MSPLLHMLTLQENMNTRVHPDWRSNNNKWYRAVWTECAEMMDHHGWKWWKKQRPDWEQIRLELVDIWHFGMSMLLQNHASAEDALPFMDTSYDEAPAEGEFNALIDELAKTALSQQRFNVPVFKGLLQHAQMDLSDLYSLYVGKNVLNMFRQDNGYQSGAYQKIWNGREDNEWLSDILVKINNQRDDFQQAIYHALEEAYPEQLLAE